MELQEIIVRASGGLVLCFVVYALPAAREPTNQDIKLTTICRQSIDDNNIHFG